MENNFQAVQPGESRMEQINPIKVVKVNDVQEFLEQQSQEFELSEMEYKEGKKDKFTLYGKIASIMGDLDRIPKTGYNKSQGYYYVTESDITGAVRPLMAKQKIVMIPSIRNYKVEEVATKYSKLNMGTIEIKWNVIDGESGEQVTFSMIGKGTDTTEKDIYKAITGNKKYALITLFMIDSGDDPERDDPNQNQNQNQNQNKNKNQNQNQNKNQNQGDSPYNYMNGDGSQNQNKAPQTNENKNGGQTSNNDNKNESGSSSKQSEGVKQPNKSDLITRWMVLAGNDQSKAESRKQFDAWYDKKKKEQWDHLAMMKALTQKLQEKNQADQKAEKEQGNKKDESKDKSQDKKDAKNKKDKGKQQDDGDMSEGEYQALKNGGAL